MDKEVYLLPSFAYKCGKLSCLVNCSPLVPNDQMPAHHFFSSHFSIIYLLGSLLSTYFLILAIIYK